jgi:hypothetical protein
MLMPHELLTTSLKYLPREKRDGNVLGETGDAELIPAADKGDVHRSFEADGTAFDPELDILWARLVLGGGMVRVGRVGEIRVGGVSVCHVKWNAKKMRKGSVTAFMQVGESLGSFTVAVFNAVNGEQTRVGTTVQQTPLSILCQALDVAANRPYKINDSA